MEGRHKPPPRLTSSGSLTTVITLLIILRSAPEAGPRRRGVPESRAAGPTMRGRRPEMDTTNYDVSVLSSVRHRRGPSPAPGGRLDRPSAHAQVQKPPRHFARRMRPEMAAMIGVKKEGRRTTTAARPVTAAHLKLWARVHCRSSAPELWIHRTRTLIMTFSMTGDPGSRCWPSCMAPDPQGGAGVLGGTGIWAWEPDHLQLRLVGP